MHLLFLAHGVGMGSGGDPPAFEPFLAVSAYACYVGAGLY